MLPDTAIVVTTIFEPTWLTGYLDNLRTYGREQSTRIIIIIDQKTPPSVLQAAADAQRAGFDVICPTLEEQTAYLARLNLPADFIPWNTDNRRNIGFMMAWEAGVQTLISIDDDNYCRADSDFVGEHHHVQQTADSNTSYLDQPGWYNLCERLTLKQPQQIFARGFPYHSRNHALTAGNQTAPASHISINAGLWLDDPDVDALTRLAQGPRATTADNAPILLGPQTWSPINTQNTALNRAAIPAYYYVRMGFPVKGLQIDRYGDILSGYFVQKCAKSRGELVRIGGPVADHRRSPHNLFKDLYHELAGIVIVEELLPWLMELPLQSHDYADLYAELADALDDNAAQFKGFIWDDGGRDFLHDTAACMRQWLTALQRISSH